MQSWHISQVQIIIIIIIIIIMNTTTATCCKENMWTVQEAGGALWILPTVLQSNKIRLPEQVSDKQNVGDIGKIILKGMLEADEVR